MKSFHHFRNPSAKAVVTTGEGRFYSNGIDLDWVNYTAETGPAAFDADVNLMKLTLKFLTCPLPTIALINGRYTGADPRWVTGVPRPPYDTY